MVKVGVKLVLLLSVRIIVLSFITIFVALSSSFEFEDPLVRVFRLLIFSEFVACVFILRF